MTEGVNKLGRGKSKSAKRFRRKVSSGNVVPAVGMCEGATPRRMKYLSIAKLKFFILLPEITSIYFMFVSASILYFRRGFAPSGFPTRWETPVTPFNRLAAQGSRGVTLEVSCTLRRPRRNCIGKLISGKA